MRERGTYGIGDDTKLSDASVGLLSRRNLLAALAWVMLVTVLWGTDLLVKFSEQETLAAGKAADRLIAEQVTSAIAALLMVTFVVRWLVLFPLRRDRWAAAIIGHTAGSVIFAFGHYALMVAMRWTWYGMLGLPYVWREPFVNNLIVEYQKDIKIYMGFVVTVAAWQLVTNRRPPPEPQRPNRLSVQTGQGTTFVDVDNVDFLEASRNYVVIHAGGREYLVRDTISRLAGRLDPSRFLRTHRSYIVNVTRIREIRSVDSRPRIFLSSGPDLPLSRSYREAVKKALGA